MTAALRNNHKAPLASTYADLIAIMKHPAFRLGALDASKGRPLLHDDILSRIADETPRGCSLGGLWTEITTVQRRYEEGRLAVAEFGIKFRSWNHPDHPPADVLRLCSRLAQERAK